MSGYYVSVPASTTSDHTCQLCPLGHTPAVNLTACLLCADNEVSSVGVCSRCRSGYSPVVAKDWCAACALGFAGTDGFCHECPLGVSFNDQPGAVACKALEMCHSVGIEFEAASPSVSSNRVCAPVTACEATITFQSAVPTATSDRMCTPCRDCDNTQYEDRACRLAADRVCKPLTLCTVAEFETKPATVTSDRVCISRNQLSSVLLRFAPLVLHSKGASRVEIEAAVLEAVRASPLNITGYVDVHVTGAGAGLAAYVDVMVEVTSEAEAAKLKAAGANHSIRLNLSGNLTTASDIAASSDTSSSGSTVSLLLFIIVVAVLGSLLLLVLVAVVVLLRRTHSPQTTLVLKPHDFSPGSRPQSTIMEYDNPTFKKVEEQSYNRLDWNTRSQRTAAGQYEISDVAGRRTPPLPAANYSEPPSPTTPAGKFTELRGADSTDSPSKPLMSRYSNVYRHVYVCE
jgi:hypothetical protein